MLMIPTIVKKSLLYPNQYGCFICSPIKKNSIIFENNKDFGIIQLSSSQFKEVIKIIISLPNEEQKKKLLSICDLFEFDRSNKILPISNIAYLNSSGENYNVQYTNGVLYSIRDIEIDEELISSIASVHHY